MKNTSKKTATKATVRGGRLAAHAAPRGAASPAAAGPLPDLAAARRLVLELLAIPGGSGKEKDVAEHVALRLREAGCPAAAI
ncbi:MAG: hypothetical protein ACKOTB_15255, partial [Planctomycetia bacterium]